MCGHRNYLTCLTGSLESGASGGPTHEHSLLLQAKHLTLFGLTLFGYQSLAMAGRTLSDQRRSRRLASRRAVEMIARSLRMKTYFAPSRFAALKLPPALTNDSKRSPKGIRIRSGKRKQGLIEGTL